MISVLTRNRVLAELETFARSCVLDLVLTRSCVFLIQSRCRDGTQPHIDLMHFVAATIFTFTIHSQRVVWLVICEKAKRLEESTSRRVLREKENVARHSLRGPPVGGEVRRCLPRRPTRA